MLPLPEDEAPGRRCDVMFATRSGNVRRNELSDFVNVNRNGKIAMKLDEGDRIVGVAICTPSRRRAADHARRAAASASRSDEVRVFEGRDSTGVRGIGLAEGDQVISWRSCAMSRPTPASAPPI